MHRKGTRRRKNASAGALALNKPLQKKKGADNVVQKRRRGKPGPPVFAPEIAEELFQWVVDTINNIRGRISSDLLKGQAMSILADYERYWRI